MKFQKGVMSSPNPIKPGEHRGLSTEFKPGMESIFKLPVGSVTIRQRHLRTEGPRSWIKVEEPNKWIPLAIHVWTLDGREIPRGFILHHKDENTLNDSLDNLECISRGAHALLHLKNLEDARKSIPQLEFKPALCSGCDLPIQIKKIGPRNKNFCNECKRKNHALANAASKERLYLAVLRALNEVKQDQP